MSNVTSNIYNFPAGNADVQNILITGGTQVYTIKNSETLLTSTIGLTANTTLSITADSQLRAGSQLFIHATASGAQYTLAFSGSILGQTVTIGTASNASQEFLYDGAKFYPVGASVVQ